MQDKYERFLEELNEITPKEVVFTCISFNKQKLLQLCQNKDIAFFKYNQIIKEINKNYYRDSDCLTAIKNIIES